MQLDPNFEDIQSAVISILEDICITRHSILKKSPFELHYGRKHNTDQQRLKKSMLKPEEVRESAIQEPDRRWSRKEW